MRDQVFYDAINNYFAGITNEVFAPNTVLTHKEGFIGPVLIFERNRHKIVIGHEQLTGNLLIDDNFMLKAVTVPNFIHVTNWLNQAMGKF